MNVPLFKPDPILPNAFTVRVTDAAGLSDDATMKITVIASQQTVTYISVGGDDGYVTESTETSNIGGSATATGTGTSGLRLGDDATKKQYKSVVSFDTSAIPDTATIISATLRLLRGTVASNPSAFGAITADIKSGTGFNGATTLAKQDFEAAADATAVATMSYPASNGTWSSGTLNSTGRSFVNKTGKTQLRVKFATDDDNDSTADYLGFYSGENSTSANRPQLIVNFRGQSP